MIGGSDSRRRLSLLSDPSATALFAGRRASDANNELLAKAQEMEASGESRDDIWKGTGWFKDRDSWSFESSPDEPPGYQRPEIDVKQRSVPLSRVSEDPAFEKSYPSLASTPVIHGARLVGSGNAAMFLPSSPGRSQGFIAIHPGEVWSPRANYFIQHEKQHAVDDAEGHLQGWKDDRSLPWDQQRIERRAINAGYRDIYMTPQERKETPPWATEDKAFAKMHPNIFSTKSAAVGGLPVKRLDEDVVRQLKTLTDPASLKRAGVAKGRGDMMQTLDSFGGGSGSGRNNQETPILMSAPSGLLSSLTQLPPRNDAISTATRVKLLEPPTEAPSVPDTEIGGNDRAIFDLLSRAKSTAEAEGILGAIARESGDAGLEAVNRVAKQLGIRTPWHRDFRESPSLMPGAEHGPSGRPRPLVRSE